MLRVLELLLIAAYLVHAAPPVQHPLNTDKNAATPIVGQEKASPKPRTLQGRFLHITDIHPDPFYKTYSSTDQEHACHRGTGPAGILGAETTDCDTPLSLVNATFKWIDENLKDTVDFVIWTGDSARHDNDEQIPRTEKQVLSQNQMLVDKFVEVFGKDDNLDDPDPTNDFVVPIVPTFGNNDILPHNIFTPGPNRWTKKYAQVWDRFVPEEQRHSFARGGWFFIEVIPNKLAVFSLNSLYFFDSNAAVDGCDKKSEPGYEQLEWLRIQLQFLRKRNVKAIITGHVPPARTESKQSWDETCWQKYTLWMKQYRDVIVGAVWGHMNIDHFMFQDFKEVEYPIAGQVEVAAVDRSEGRVREDIGALGDHFNIQSSTDYLSELTTSWKKLPSPPKKSSWPQTEDEEGKEDVDITKKKDKKKKKKKSKKDKEKKFLKKIGGEWAERFSLSLVSPSVIPNYYPTLRVVEYNITGLEGTELPPFSTPVGSKPAPSEGSGFKNELFLEVDDSVKATEHDTFEIRKGKDIFEPSKKKPKKPKKPGFTVPKGPSKSSPPGPAYSPQTLTLVSYVQYFANLTHINNDFPNASSLLTGLERSTPELESFDTTKDSPLYVAKKWRDGKHADKDMPDNVKHKKPNPREFKYEVEYDTRNDSIYRMRDMTVRSYYDLARRIGMKKPKKGDRMVAACGDEVDEDEELHDVVREDEDAEQALDNGDGEIEASKKKKKKGKKKKEWQNKVWFTFIKRAFVNTMDDDDVRDTFGT